jgi:hypothetical protein
MISVSPTRVWSAVRFPQRISTCETVPDLIRAAADARAAAAGRGLPLAVWCRSSVLLVLKAQGHSRRSAEIGAPRTVLPWRSEARRVLRTIIVKTCLGAASLVLDAAGLLLRAGILRSKIAKLALHYSSKLTAFGMRLWRPERSRGRR